MDLFLPKPLIIAVDGYSSCGKSTLAKQIAKQLNYIFVDSGAMYRATTLFFLDNDVDIDDPNAVEVALLKVNISFENNNGFNTTYLNDKNIESEIRTLRVSDFVSEVSAISSVRRKMVDLQRKMGNKQGIVMDGRDIGTVVFPDADVKLFITADPMIRAKRRWDELNSNGHNITMDEVIANLAHRDKIDTERKDSPLKMAEDAILIDNTHLSIQTQFDLAIQIIKPKLVI